MVLAVGALAACGGGGSEAGSGGSDTIVFGSLIATTATAGSIGVGIQHGVDLAASDINAAGGIKVGSKTYKVKIKPYDTAGDAAQGLTQLTRMVESDNIHFLIGPDTSTVGSAILPFLKQHSKDLPVVVAGAGLGTLTQAPNVFRMSGTIAGNNTQNIKEQKALGFKRAALVTDIKNSGEVESTPETISDYKAAGIDLVTQQTIQTGQTDFTSLIAKIRNTKPDVVFLRMYEDEQLLFIKQARQLGWNVPITAVNATPVDLVGSAIAPNLMTNVYEIAGPTWANLADHGSEAAKSATARYKAKFGSDPGGLTYTGYEATMAMAGAIRQAGTLSPDKVIAALASLKPYPGEFYPLNEQDGYIFGKDHEISVDFVATKWENGKIVSTESVK
jgi:branched-chain amino acid transport system substrate-binding protein